MSIRALVVGLGQIGMGYDLHHDPNLFVMTHARAFQVHPAFELAGGVDSDTKRISLFESQYSRPGYTNLAVALKERQPELVVIATPTELHIQTLYTILENHIPKAVLCEKPLAYNLEQATAMVDACESSGVKFYVNYMRRSDRGVAEVKRRIGDGRISRPIKGVSWYSKGLFNNGSHFVNLLQYWLGRVVEFEVISRGRLWNGLDPEPDVRVSFELGEIFFLAAREEDYSHYTIELVCGNGRLRYEQGGTQIFWQSASIDPAFEGYKILTPEVETIVSDLGRIQWQVVDQLAASLGGQDAFICSGSEALNTSKVLDQFGRNS